MSQGSRYLLAEQLPDGAWQAKDTHLDRQVVVKGGWSEPDRQRLQSQLTALSTAQNRHVADVYDLLSLDGGGLAIVEEFMDGSSLVEWANAMPADEGAVLRTLLQMVSAVAALNSGGLEAASLDPVHWRFDSEGILNLTPYPLASSGPKEPQTTGTSAFRQFSSRAQWLVQRYADITATPLPAAADPMLAGFLTGDPNPSYSIEQYRDRINAHCLRDQHRAVAVYRGQSSEMNHFQRTLRLTHPISGVADVSLHYDGLQFSVQQCSGEVYRNNLPVAAGAVIEGSCVITLGAPTRPWSERYFVTLDITHPEVLF